MQQPSCRTFKPTHCLKKQSEASRAAVAHREGQWSRLSGGRTLCGVTAAGGSQAGPRSAPSDSAVAVVSAASVTERNRSLFSVQHESQCGMGREGGGL